MPNGTKLPEFLNRNELMVCHEPQLEATNTTMGPYVPPEEAAEAVRRRLYGGADDEGEADGAAEGAAAATARRRVRWATATTTAMTTMSTTRRRRRRRRPTRRRRRRGGGATARRRLSTGTTGGTTRPTAATRRAASGTGTARSRCATRGRDAGAAAGGGAAGERPPARRQLQAGRRRLLYHEFETELSPWDLWLDENEEETANREAREEAMRTGDCHFYHNCTAPLPPPLVLDPFDCWKPNASNVSWLPPVLFRNPHYDEANENTTYFRTTVHCIRPSWPDADGIWCLTPHSALFCPFPDQYRGNRTELQADTEATTRSADPFSPLYVNDTSLRCHSWKVDDVYDSLASQRALFPLKPHSSTTAHLCSEGNWSACKCPNATVWPRCDRRSRPRRIEPWERPCDRYDYVAVGVHHHCALTPARDVTPDLAVASPVGQLACDGHDAHGQTSLWDKSQLRSWHPEHRRRRRRQGRVGVRGTGGARKVDGRRGVGDPEAAAAAQAARRLAPRYGYRGHDEHADVCVGEGTRARCGGRRSTGTLPCKSGTRCAAGAQTTRRRGGTRWRSPRLGATAPRRAGWTCTS